MIMWLIGRWRNDTEMILKKCAECRKPLFYEMETTEIQRKTVHIINKKYIKLEFE